MNVVSNDKLDLSVIVPVRNAAAWIEDCLKAVRKNRPGEIIVVDGRSDDDTVRLARDLADVVISDEGQGVAYARQLGAEAARCRYVAFVDVDIELSDGALEALLKELIELDADAIQARLRSIDANDYWSRALAAHHNGGRSRRWFGLTCTVFPRDTFGRYGLDHSFRSGEDIELRHRLEKAKAKAFLSQTVTVQHRFGGGFKFALGQWTADGAGLGRMVRKYGLQVFALLLLPAAGTLFGIRRSLGREVIFIPYYLLYLVFNYVGIAEGLLDRRVSRLKSSERP